MNQNLPFNHTSNLQLDKLSVQHLVFPGPYVGGVSLVLGPILILAGALLRFQFYYFAPQQLAAYQSHPALITAAYSCFALGSVVLCFGIISLASLITTWNAVWGIWGGTLAILGLFTRTFHAGIDHQAFQLVRVQNLQMATQAVSDSYSALHVFRYFDGALMVGWIVLAVGAYRSRILGLFRSIALGLMVMVPFGTLKGTEIRALGIVGLCFALIPLGISILQRASPLSRRAKIWLVSMIVGEVVFIYLSLRFPVLMN